MSEDANYFSQLQADIHTGPLLKSPDKRTLPTLHQQSHSDQMPGSRSKTSKPYDYHNQAVGLNLAQVKGSQEAIDVTSASNKLSCQMSNMPVHICETKIVQQPSKKHFSYINKTAVPRSTSKWCLSQPGHGRCIKASKLALIDLEAIIVYDTDQSCWNTMQTRFSSPFIFDLAEKMATFCNSQDVPFIQGYFIHIDSNKNESNRIQELKFCVKIIASMHCKANLEIIIIQLSGHIPATIYSAIKYHCWKLRKKEIDSYDHLSYRILKNFDLIIGFSSNYFQSKIPNTADHLSPTPAVCHGMSINIFV
jgi:hypothetical protein